MNTIRSASAGTPVTMFAPTAAGYATLATRSGINQTNLGQLQAVLGHGRRRTAGPTQPYPRGLDKSASGRTTPSGRGQTIRNGPDQFHSPTYTNNSNCVGSVDYNISEQGLACAAASS